MTLKDSRTIWGTDSLSLKEYCKFYSFYDLMLFILDFIILVTSTVIMYRKQADWQSFTLAILLLCSIFYVVRSKILNPIKWQSYKFFLRFRNKPLVEVSYKVTANQLYSILYCAGIKHLSVNKDINFYVDKLLSACWRDNYYAKNVMKYLSKYESTEGNVTCYIVKNGRKSYFIDFKSVEDIEDGTDTQSGND